MTWPWAFPRHCRGQTWRKGQRLASWKFSAEQKFKLHVLWLVFPAACFFRDHSAFYNFLEDQWPLEDIRHLQGPLSLFSLLKDSPGYIEVKSTSFLKFLDPLPLQCNSLTLSLFALQYLWLLIFIDNIFCQNLPRLSFANYVILVQVVVSVLFLFPYQTFSGSQLGLRLHSTYNLCFWNKRTNNLLDGHCPLDRHPAWKVR